jgi:hypothetical protein
VKLGGWTATGAWGGAGAVDDEATAPAARGEPHSAQNLGLPSYGVPQLEQARDSA